jgi:hypothetical protein
MVFRVDSDEWSKDGRSILSPEALQLIKSTLERTHIIVEHWFFYGSRAPDRLIFEDFADFEEYLSKKAQPGDAFHVWDYGALCRDDNVLTHGKYPDSDGAVPRKGAY